MDSTLLTSLAKKNKENLSTMDSAISDAKENLGESEVITLNTEMSIKNYLISYK